MKPSKKRQRFLMMLLFPLLAAIFFCGLVASLLKKEDTKTGKVKKLSAQIAPYDLEMGLILKEEEEEIHTKTRHL